jgi:hypothetical protein
MTFLSLTALPFLLRVLQCIQVNADARNLPRIGKTLICIRELATDQGIGKHPTRSVRKDTQ